MSKIIKMTPEHIEECKRDFEESLRNAKLSDGRISFSKSFSSIDRKARVMFTEIAWLKMQTLIREFNNEVAWHGIAMRGDDDDYIISDILVYPQEVTGATVTTDQEKYQMWLMSHEDDVFNNIRMQGHSHVNMQVTPSGVDTSLYDRILDQLDDTMFYIFMIYNKRGDKTIKIYDMAKNVMFDTSDVTVAIMDDGTGTEKFLRDAKEMVKTKSYTPTVYQYPRYQPAGEPYNPIKTPAATSPANTGNNSSVQQKSDNVTKHNAGSKPDKKKSKAVSGTEDDIPGQTSYFGNASPYYEDYYGYDY